ncbi:Hypothetical predicted protein [Mytilus galloprovincialis]|uniref:Uncharacterized protein n=1 Tax=Mytilus galloprovincialis TaxID=29158 RepID=A0A8B6DTR3_MYTGA|nr:Hypothetical predicted protein [Mytilus galloprovincialis]
MDRAEERGRKETESKKANNHKGGEAGKQKNGDEREISSREQGGAGEEKSGHSGVEQGRGETRGVERRQRKEQQGQIMWVSGSDTERRMGSGRDDGKKETRQGGCGV